MPFSNIRGRGTYAPLSERYYFDDAIAEAGPDAELMFLRGLAFLSGARTDGFVSERQTEIAGIRLSDVPDRCKELVRVGLWVPDEERGGFRVRSWLKWNRSAEEIEKFAAADAARKRAGRGPSGGNPDGVRTDSGGSPSGIRQQSRAEQIRAEQIPTGHSVSGLESLSREARESAGPPADAGAGEPAPDEPGADAAPSRAVPPPPEIAELRARLAAKTAIRRARGAR